MEKPLNKRFDRALVYASDVHRGQKRNKTNVPYIAHPLGVCALVLEAGGDEDQAVAALLHDTAEDHGGRIRLDDIRENFGDRVARIVEGCSDDLDHLNAPWRRRKELYLEHLRTAPEEVLLVSLADKLHNARAVLLESREVGKDVFRRFQGGLDYSRWYEPALLEIFQARINSPLLDEFSEVVARLRTLAR